LLAEILARLATFLENTARLRKKVKSAMMYPDRRDLRRDYHHHLPSRQGRSGLRRNLFGFRRETPAPTQFPHQPERMAQSNLLYLIPAAGLHRLRLDGLHQTKQGREFWDRTRIKLPIFGHIAHKICLARFTRTLASL
jgi:type IV pilus assembly protein PilC